MKASFRVLQSRSTVTVRLTRDSVCAGDDLHVPHDRKMDVHSFTDPVALVRQLCTGFLPTVAGSEHSWTCEMSGQRIATVQGSGATVEAKVRAVRYERENHVHFSYSPASG